MSKFTVLGVELEFDFFDADELEKYASENNKVQDDFDGIDYKALSTSDALRAQCKIINSFFDRMFGDGTAEKLFKGKNNIKDHLEAFAAVTNKALSCDVELRSIANTYSPNRAQRRFEQKNGHRQNGAPGSNGQNGNRKSGNRG